VNRLSGVITVAEYDPGWPGRFEGLRREYAAALPNAELVEYADAGHWAWLDRPDMIERVAAFLSGG